MRFTVVIPAYKDNFLSEAIESVITQTYEDWELIVLDDCSPGKIKDIVSQHISDNRIRYYRNKVNVGAVNVVDNWNLCLQLATGEYLICMGDDDVLDVNCLYIYSQYIDSFPGYDIYHGMTKIIDEDSKLYSIQEARPLTESVYSMVWHRINRKREQFIGDFLFRVSALREKGNFYKLPLAWGADDISSYRCAIPHGIVNVPKILYNYRVNSYSISSSEDIQNKLIAVKEKYTWILDNIINSRPDNEMDEIYRQLIAKKIDKVINRETVSSVAYNLGKKPVRQIIFLVHNKNRFGLSNKQILVGLILRVVRNIYNRY